MATDTPRIPEQGVATLPDEAWERAPSCGDHQSVGAVGDGRARSGRYGGSGAGLVSAPVYVLIRRARQGSGLVTDLVPGQSGGGKGKGACRNRSSASSTSYCKSGS